MSNTLTAVRKAPCKNTMGIEIECSIPTTGLKWKHLGFFYVGDDLSLEFPYNSSRDIVELVSQPLTPRWLEREILRVEKKVGHWEVNKSCGIHVHVNKEWFSHKKARTLYEKLQKLSDVEKESLFGRDGNEYCQYDEPFLGDTRYSALNVKPAATVEFRMFSSGNTQWAIYCVRMVEWMVNNWKVAKPSRMLEASQQFKQQLNIQE